MKIELFDTKEFIDLNQLKEVTSSILFQRGGVPHPNGLISNEIFGITTKSRKETFAYINLHGHFFSPHIYKAIKRFFRDIEKIINGEKYFSIDKSGFLVPDENGDTGIEFLYDNWEKIKWKYSNEYGMRNERLDLITKSKKNEIFTEYCIVIPAFYRDIAYTENGSGKTGEINQLYCKLIRYVSLIRNKDIFDFQFGATNYNIQNTLVDIYDYFKNKLEKKAGLLRKYLMGKNVDNCTRTVITASTFHAEKPEDLVTDLRHVAIPISQVCSLCYPFVIHWIKTFFERELLDKSSNKIIYNPSTDKIETTVELDNPESYFNEKLYKKIIDTYIKDPESRFNTIDVPIKGKKTMKVVFTGKKLDPTTTAELSSTSYRAMTWTDLLYLASYNVTKDKYCLITRYPLLDEFGIFVGKVRVLSTEETDIVSFNGEIYNNYPRIDFTVSPEKMATKFIDSVQFSNSVLPGLDGDYDGDQTTVKILYTQEANEECKRYMNSKAFFINASGQNIRKIENEAVQTFYTLTKEPKPNSNKLSDEDKQLFLSLKPNDITFSMLVNWFGDTVNITDNIRNNNKKKSKYNPTDILTISPSEYSLIKEPTVTTLGRLIFNKIIVEKIGLQDVLGYVNYVLDDGGFGKVENIVTESLKEDKISVEQMYEYTDTRDWLGLQLHAVITTSFTPGVLKVPTEVKKLKKELLKKYEKEIKAGDPKVSELIEKELIAKTKEVLKDDVGLDLYVSGARGSIGNNYKNMYLMRGAIKNSMNDNFDIITSSLLDGLQKNNIAAHANSIVAGSLPKAVIMVSAA